MKEQEDRPGFFDSSEIIISWDKSSVIYETSTGSIVHNPEAVCEYFIEELGATKVNTVRSSGQDGETASRRFTIEWDHSETNYRPPLYVPDPADLTDVKDRNN